MAPYSISISTTITTIATTISSRQAKKKCGFKKVQNQKQSENLQKLTIRSSNGIDTENFFFFFYHEIA